MTEAWTSVRLGEISSINYGYTAKASFDVKGPKFLRITDIQDGMVDWNRVPSCPINEDDYKKHELRHDDIVFARTGATTGKSFRVQNPDCAVAASYLIRLRLIDKTVLPSFVSLFFQTAEYWEAVRVGTTGSAQGGFNASKLAELRLNKPPLFEQKRIVEILDQAFTGIDQAIANTEKNLISARELFQHGLESVFSNDAEWTKEELGKNIHFIDYRGKTPPKTERGVRLITAKNVKMGYVQNHPEEFMEETAFSNWMSRGYPKEGDVLFTTEAPLGNIAQLGFYDRVAVGQRLITMRPKEELIDKAFLKYRLMSPQTQKEIHARATGATVLGIKAKLLKLIPISYPELPEQQKISTMLDDLTNDTKKLESIYTTKLSSLGELKKSLLQKAFSGELTANMAKDMAEAAE